MMKIFTVAIFFLVTFATEVVCEENLKLITVRDKNFNIVKQISDTTVFSKLWGEKVIAPVGTRSWIYKIDIEPGDRWLYDPAGFTRLLAVKVSRDYKLNEPQTFNEVLGIYNQAEERRLEADQHSTEK